MMKVMNVLFAAILVFAIANAATSGWGPESAAQHSGYITVNTKVDSGGHIFYWLFESRNDPSNDPLVLWMTGGPGCSSELAIFYEQGPYRFDDNGDVAINKFAWNSIANVLFVDQPVGTGFSYADHDEDYVVNEDQVGEDMYEFLQQFYIEYPQFKDRDLFVTGESYAGHYVPAVSNRIATANRNNEGPFKIPLKGFAIGNGMVNPQVQYNDYANYAYDNGMITESEYASLNVTVARCQKAIKSGFMALNICNSILSKIQQYAGNFNVYDIRKPCVGPLCYDFSALDKLMAKDDVLESLGVSSKAEWEQCDNKVHVKLTKDWMLNCEQWIPQMLSEGYEVLVYSGVEDFICNWYGGRDWVEQMPWYGQKEYLSKKPSPYYVGGEHKGDFTTEGPLTFLSIYEAGHMVPMDQPEVALDMLKRFITSSGYGKSASDDYNKAIR